MRYCNIKSLSFILLSFFTYAMLRDILISICGRLPLSPFFPKRNNQCCKTMGDASSFWDFPKNGNRSGCFFSYVQGYTKLALPKSTKQPMLHFSLACRGEDVSPCYTTDTQHFSFSHRETYYLATGMKIGCISLHLTLSII